MRCKIDIEQDDTDGVWERERGEKDSAADGRHVPALTYGYARVTRPRHRRRESSRNDDGCETGADSAGKRPPIIKLDPNVGTASRRGLIETRFRPGWVRRRASTCVRTSWPRRPTDRRGVIVGGDPRRSVGTVEESTVIRSQQRPV